MHPSVLPGRSYVSVGSERLSRLLFHWRARDFSLSPLTGQTPTFARATAGGTIADRAGRIRTPVHSQPRFEMYDLDGDGVRETPALLIEPQRTNIALRSEEFDNASWTKTNSTVTANADRAPDGATTADRLVESLSAVQDHKVSQAVTITADGNVALSIYAKAGTRNWVRLTLRNAAATDRVNAWFNLATGAKGSTLGDGNGVVAGSGMVALEGGWYRCWLVGKIGGGATAANAECWIATADLSESYEGDGASDLSIWGAQVENNVAYASSYIATAASTVTRNADTLSSAFAFGSGLTADVDDFTWYAKLARPAHADVTGALGADPGIFVVSTVVGQCYVHFDATARNIVASINTAGTDASASRAVPAGAAIEVCAQFQSLTVGGKARLDVGAGFGALSSAAAAFSSFGNTTLGLGVLGTDALGAALIDLKGARGQFTMQQMREEM